jgi:hypothetical protein
MGRIQRGFKLAGVSWRVLVAEPAIFGVLLAGLVGMVVASAGLFGAVFHRLPNAADFRFPNYLITLPVLWLGTIVSSYCNVVVAVMADRRLRGTDATVSEAMSVANARLGRILGWTVVSIGVGLILRVIAERFRLGGVIASRLFGIAWGLATTFVIPIVALEDLGVRDSIRRSASTFKAKWGESVVAQGTVGLAVLLVALPASLVAVALLAASVPVGIVAIVIVVGSMMVVSGALDAVVDVALYRYAVDGEVLGAFTRADLDSSYRPKGKRRGLLG